MKHITKSQFDQMFIDILNNGHTYGEAISKLDSQLKAEGYEYQEHMNELENWLAN